VIDFLTLHLLHERRGLGKVEVKEGFGRNVIDRGRWEFARDDFLQIIFREILCDVASQL
jgi:hypothetical protein